MGEGLVTNVARVALSCTCLARIIHEGFYCNRRYVAATSLTAGGLAARSVNILFQVALPRGLGSGACLAHSYKGAQPPCRIPPKGAHPLRNFQAGRLPRLTAPRARLACRLGGFVTNLRE
jgi:hypothetical protein